MQWKLTQAKKYLLIMIVAVQQKCFPQK